MSAGTWVGLDVFRLKLKCSLHSGRNQLEFHNQVIEFGMFGVELTLDIDYRLILGEIFKHNLCKTTKHV